MDHIPLKARKRHLILVVALSNHELCKPPEGTPERYRWYLQKEALTYKKLALEYLYTAWGPPGCGRRSGRRKVFRENMRESREYRAEYRNLARAA